MRPSENWVDVGAEEGEPAKAGNKGPSVPFCLSYLFLFFLWPSKAAR